MAMVSKQVRFYRPVLIDEHGNEKDFADDFWAELRKTVDVLNLKARTSIFSGTTYSGNRYTAKAPAVNYFKVGRQRPPGEFPDTIDVSTGSEGALSIGALHLLESAWMVPFGTQNIVAIMSPLVGLVSIAAIERWLTTVSGVVLKGQSIELRPIIDTQVLHKLNDVASGLTKLKVRVPPGESIDLPKKKSGKSRSKVEAAIEEATSETTDELSLEMVWSFGHAKPTDKESRILLRAAQALAKAGGADALEVSMMMPKDDDDAASYRVEQHNLLQDRVTATAKFERLADSQPTEESVLTGIQGAIEEYRGRGTI